MSTRATTSGYSIDGCKPQAEKRDHREQQSLYALPPVRVGGRGTRQGVLAWVCCAFSKLRWRTCPLQYTQSKRHWRDAGEQNVRQHAKCRTSSAAVLCKSMTARNLTPTLHNRRVANTLTNKNKDTRTHARTHAHTQSRGKIDVGSYGRHSQGRRSFADVLCSLKTHSTMDRLRSLHSGSPCTTRTSPGRPQN